MKTRYGWMLLALSLMLVLAACGGGAAPSGGSSAKPAAVEDESAPADDGKPIELSYAFFAPAGTFPAKQMEKWKEELEKRTNGKVVVNLFPGGTLLDAANMYNGVRNKVADIGLSVMTYDPSKFPLMTIAELPHGFPNAKVASQVVFDLMQEYPQQAFSDMKLITAFATEPAYIQSKEPIGSLADIKGKQLRISGALAPLLSELGASPVGMSQSEAVEAMQTGVIEGYVSSREVLMDLKFAEMAPYWTDYPLTVSTFAAVMNIDTWNSLPPDVQKIIDELAPEMAAWAGEYLDNHVKEAMDWAVTEHNLQVVTLTPEEKAAWDAKLVPLQQKAIADLQEQGLPAEEFKNRLDELKKKYSAQ